MADQSKTDKALALAHQYAPRGYATGGRVGYAEGGDINPSRIARQIQERTMRGLDLTEDQQAFLDKQAEQSAGRERRFNAAAPGVVGGIANELAKGLLPPIFYGWNTPTWEEAQRIGRERDERRAAMTPEERRLDVAKDYLSEALPYALPEIGSGVGAAVRAFPKTSRAVVGGPGMFAAPALAGEAPEQIKARQERLKAAGFYKGDIDGNDGPATREAQKQFDASRVGQEMRDIERRRIEAEIARAQAQSGETQLRRQETEAAERRRREGEERLTQAERDVDPFNRILRDYGPTAGYATGAALGLLSKYGVNKAYNARSQDAAARANALLKQSPKADVPERVANINQFWSEGQGVPAIYGSRSLPFESNPGQVPAFKANSNAVSSSDLYLPSRAANALTDLGVATGYGAESAYAQSVMEPRAERELAAARTAFKDDPSEANLTRLQAAMNQSATAEFLTNLGRAGGMSYLAGGLKMRRDPTRPDISKAEAERIRLDELLAARTGGPNNPGSGLRPEGTDLPRLPLPQDTAGANAMLPATPIRSSPARTELPEGLGLPSQSASASPEPKVTFVPVIRSPSGTFHYSGREHMPEGLNAHPGGFVSGEHRPKTAKKPKAEKPKREAAAAEDTGAGLTDRKRSKIIEADEVPQKPAKAFDPDDPVNRGLAKGGLVARTRDLVRRYAHGGKVVLGGLKGDTGGREDALPVSVPNGAFVISADVVSALGQGNSNAGLKRLTEMFGAPRTNFVAGGPVGIKISDGEFIVSPEQVTELGGGDINAGHKRLEEFMRQVRADHIHTLQNLPGPAR